MQPYQEIESLETAVGARGILRAEIKPTPNPAKNLPARNKGREVAAVWKITPRMKTQDEAISAQRRPIVSAMKGEAKAPKKVPADKMETMADDSDGVTSRWPLESRYPVEKRSRQ